LIRQTCRPLKREITIRIQQHPIIIIIVIVIVIVIVISDPEMLTISAGA
jgi:hypothetical protein